jgi:hypothetical protein
VYLKTKTLLPSLNLQVPHIKNKMAKGLEEMKERREEEKGRGRKKNRGGKGKLKGEKRKEIKKWEAAGTRIPEEI